MLIGNARLRGKDGLWTVRIEGTRIQRITQDKLAAEPGERIIDAAGGMVLPPFVEPHIHLDATLTSGDPVYNESGTLFEGIEIWAKKKAELTREDVKRRATTALKWQAANGVQHVRTHVDVTDRRLTALQALLEVKAEVAPWMDLQLCAFPQEGILSFQGGHELLEEALRMGADVVGAIPHIEFTRDYGVESIERMFRLAEKYDRTIDVHCDEIDDEQSRFTEVVAAEALRRGYGRRVALSHTTAMHSYNGAYVAKLFRLLRKAEVSFISLPLVNIHLQGRFDGYPKRRGVTRVKEMLEHGINVCFGLDSIADPWYPFGTGSLLEVLFFGVHVCHLTGHRQIEAAVDLITTNGAQAISLGDDYGIAEGNPANLLVLPAQSPTELVRVQEPVRYSIRQGAVIAETLPRQTCIYAGGIEERIHFK